MGSAESVSNQLPSVASGMLPVTNLIINKVNSFNKHLMSTFQVLFWKNTNTNVDKTVLLALKELV